ncbi:hypothetical protein [Cellulomonas cellasea]|uniref:Uncharacterized protein n=1 Tax=Cellulomonas cellasea TaxID=43670 RepID=A0A7W4YBQ8_9CELL|nr:hypothetical protein [Cellulomonas cellasea]MBB2923002.1 hypothetical protein [Cellulomonas cellasea]
MELATQHLTQPNQRTAQPAPLSAQPAPWTPATGTSRRTASAGALLGLQRSAGNAAVTRIVHPAPAGPVVQRQPVPAGVPAADRDALLQASLVLSKAPPLSTADLGIVARAVPGAVVVDMIRERDERSARLAERVREMERGERERQSPPEHGVPPNDAMMADVRGQVDALRQEVEQLNGQITPLLDELGVAPGEQGQRERAMVHLVTEEFPARFEERARQIARTQLDQNEAIVTEEIARYAGICTVAPSDRERLQAAAREIDGLQRDVEALAEEEQRVQADLPDAGVTSAHQRLPAMREHRETQERALQQRTAEAQVAFPVLLQVSPAQVAAADEATLDRLLGAKLTEIRENIASTKENIESGRLRVWNLPDVVRLTSQDLGITGNVALMATVDERARRQASDAALVAIAVAAVGLTAGIVAAIATGGLFLVAAGVAVVASGFQLSQSVQNFAAESAASNIALDPQIADLSAHEPDLFAVALDVAGLVLDVAQVVRAVNALRVPTRVLLDTGEAGDFIAAARSALPPAAAERAIAGVVQRAAGQRAIRAALRAVKEGTAFSAASLDKIERLLKAVAEPEWAEAFARMRSAGRVHPLTEEALRHVYGDAELARLVEAGALRPDAGGLFISAGTETGHIFLTEGRVDQVTSVVVHELTHHLQDVHRAALDGFRTEFQAWLAQRDFVTRLARQAGDNGASLPEDLRALLQAEPDDIANTIAVTYQVPFPGRYSAVRELTEVLAMLRSVP